MRWLLNRFFSVQSMVKQIEPQGEIPSTQEAYRDVLSVAVPSIAEMVLIALIGMVDTMMVGNVLGSTAIASVSLVGQPRMLFLAMFFAINIGVTSIVARRKGEGRQADANNTLKNAIILIFGMSIVLTGLALAISRPLMSFAGANADTIVDAEIYFRILMWFLPVNALTMCICAAQRGVGNTRITMYVNVASNLINVIFNYLLIGGNYGFPRLGVKGAAIATAIGFCIGFVLSLLTIFDHRKNSGFLRISRYDRWHLDRKAIRDIMKVGGNAMFEQAALRVGFFAYAKIVAGLGTAAFAAHSVCMQFLNLSFCFGDGIGIAGTALVGQTLGQKRPDLSMLYGRISQRMALIASIGIALLIVVFRNQLVWLFSESQSDADVMLLAAKVMVIVAMFQPLQMSSVVISGALRGSGDTKFVALVMGICVMVVRPTLSLLAVYVLQYVVGRPDIALMGCWSASLFDMAIRLYFVNRRFNGGKWQQIVV